MKVKMPQTRCKLLSVHSLDQTPSSCYVACVLPTNQRTVDTMISKWSLDTQNGVKRQVLVERYHFYNYKQTDGQSLTDYLAELRHLSATCDCRTAQQLADNLRDRFVMSLKNERLLEQLLTKDHMKPLEELFQLALTFIGAEWESL